MKTDRTKSLERAVLGAPFVPPSRLVRWVTTARRRLLGLHELTAGPPVRILETLFAQLDAHVLRVLVELGIPDLLDRPRSVLELAALLDLDDDSFERLIRYAATRDFVAVDKKGIVRATGVTVSLQSDAVAPWHAWVRFATSRWFDEAFRHLGVGIARRSTLLTGWTSSPMPETSTPRPGLFSIRRCRPGPQYRPSLWPGSLIGLR